MARPRKTAPIGNDVATFLRRAVELRDDPFRLVHYLFPDLELAEWQSAYFAAWSAHIKSGSPLPFRASIVSGHGTGKSTLAGLVLWCHMLACPEARVVVLSNTWSQSVEKTMVTAIGLRSYLPEPIRELFEVTRTRISWKDEQFRHTWFASVTSWAADRLEGVQGLHSPFPVILCDEASVLPAALFEIFSGALTSGRGHLLAIGNPTSTAGYQYKIMTDPRTGEGWFKRHVASYDVPWNNRAFLDAEVKRWGGQDSDVSRVRVFGQYPRSGSLSLFPRDLLEAAVLREPVEAAERGVRPILACDPAYQGADLAVIALRTGASVRILETIPKCDDLDLAERLDYLAKAHRCQAIVVDCTGSGSEGPLAVLKARRNSLPPAIRLYPFNSAASASPGRGEAHFINARVEVYHRLLDALRQGLALPADDDLVEELLATERDGSDGRGRMKLVAKKAIKEAIGRSPDKADAIALTFAVSIRQSETVGLYGSGHDGRQTSAIFTPSDPRGHAEGGFVRGRAGLYVPAGASEW